MRFNDIVLKPGERVALNAGVRKAPDVPFIKDVTFVLTVTNPETEAVIDTQKLKAIFLDK